MEPTFPRNPEHDRKRQESNLAILAMIQEKIEKYPMLRFQQILWNLDITDGLDRFHEEPWDTLARIEGKSRE